VNATPGGSTAPPNTVSTVTITADKTAPQPVGTTVTFTAQPTGGIAPYQYKWLVSDGSTSTVAVNWTTSNRFTWTPTESGSYAVSVWVRSAGNAADVQEASTSLAFTTSTGTAAATAVAMTANRVAP
jgi:cell wall-associated protease